MAAEIARLCAELERMKAQRERGAEAGAAAGDSNDDVEGLIRAMTQFTKTISDSAAHPPAAKWVPPSVRLERFLDRPQDRRGQSVYEWVRDMKGRLEVIKGTREERAAFVIGT